jgi:hypothetical protein
MCATFYDLALRLVNYELDRIWKEMVLAQSQYNAYMLVELLRNTTTNLFPGLDSNGV